MMIRRIQFAILLMALGLLPALQAAEPAGKFSVASAAPASGNTALVLSSPPRGTKEQDSMRFKPIAEYLSRALGRPVVYEFPGNWGAYQGLMQTDKFDIVFDGPHFVSWRIEKLGHNAAVRLPGEFVVAAFTRKSETRYRHIDDLKGRRFCGAAPPNLGTLAVYASFTNPAYQPTLVLVPGWRDIYDTVVAGKKCEAGILPVSHIRKFDPNGEQVRIIHQAQAMPEQAWTTSKRVTTSEREKLIAAMLSPDGKIALKEFAATYGLKRDFVRATNAEYAGLSRYLKGTPGF